MPGPSYLTPPQSPNPGQGAVVSGVLGAASVLSGNIASGQVAAQHVASGVLLSGNMASGFVTNLMVQFNLANVETVSGVKAVVVTSGGALALAMAGSGLRLPAIGVAENNGLSGEVNRVVQVGRLSTTFDATWSGMAGKPLYVGSGGMIVTQSGLISGMSWQKLGVAFSGGIFVNVNQSITSGAITANGAIF